MLRVEGCSQSQCCSPEGATDAVVEQGQGQPEETMALARFPSPS